VGAAALFQRGAPIFHQAQRNAAPHAGVCFSSRTSPYRLAGEFGLNTSKVAKGTGVAKCCRIDSSGPLWLNYVHYFEWKRRKRRGEDECFVHLLRWVVASIMRE